MLTLKQRKIEVTEIYLELVYHLYKKNGFREMKDEKGSVSKVGGMLSSFIFASC